MKDPTVRGVVHLIEETKTFGQKGFRKRLVVLEQSKGTFTNFVPVEFVKDGCDAVDDLAVGDEIEVTYRLSGRRWQRDEASEAKYFLSAEGLRHRPQRRPCRGRRRRRAVLNRPFRTLPQQD
jgi:hypothetical protein